MLVINTNARNSGMYNYFKIPSTKVSLSSKKPWTVESSKLLKAPGESRNYLAQRILSRVVITVVKE